MKNNTIVKSCMMGLSALIFAACASNVKLADIPSTANPQLEMEKLEADHLKAIQKNIDVLASSEFKKSREWYEEAKSDQASQQSQEEILTDIRKARGFLEQAYKVSENRMEKAPGLFESRQMALQAGASKHSELKDDLESLDEDVSDVAAKLANVDSAKITALQERYSVLERRATILAQLGSSQAQLNGAKRDDADDRAPLTYKKAELSLKNAESVISSSLRNPAGYQSAVAKALEDTALLNDVMATIPQNGKDVPESVALTMVAQNRRIKTLDTNLSQSKTESASNTAMMNKKNQALSTELESQGQDLTAANAGLAGQKAMEEARSQFSDDEAEAYQQGGKLVIRLKKVNFASGSSALQGDSIEVLAKVSAIAKSMNASELKVEGHTDSTGTAAQNRSISEKRASTVATYFKTNGFDDVKSQGFGFQKPIATNKSKEGRAQNRRVDIIITPDNATVE